jgi:hypothetical protein
MNSKLILQICLFLRLLFSIILFARIQSLSSDIKTWYDLPDDVKALMVINFALLSVVFYFSYYGIVTQQKKESLIVTGATVVDIALSTTIFAVAIRPVSNQYDTLRGLAGTLVFVQSFNLILNMWLADKDRTYQLNMTTLTADPLYSGISKPIGVNPRSMADIDREIEALTKQTSEFNLNLASKEPRGFLPDYSTPYQRKQNYDNQRYSNEFIRDVNPYRAPSYNMRRDDYGYESVPPVVPPRPYRR